MQPIDEVPHKLDLLSYPVMVVAGRHAVGAGRGGEGVPAAVPHQPARAGSVARGPTWPGLGGHYEFNVPSVAAQNGMSLEDFGGDGRYVAPGNRNRFYFARGAAYTHSPGKLRVSGRISGCCGGKNTLWHPVKPAGVPLWHPLLFRGSPLKTTWERVKPFIGRRIIWLWFALRWRPLRPGETAGGKACEQWT